MGVLILTMLLEGNVFHRVHLSVDRVDLHVITNHHAIGQSQVTMDLTPAPHPCPEEDLVWPHHLNMFKPFQLGTHHTLKSGSRSSTENPSYFRMFQACIFGHNIFKCNTTLQSLEEEYLPELQCQ